MKYTQQTHSSGSSERKFIRTALLTLSILAVPFAASPAFAMLPCGACVYPAPANHPAGAIPAGMSCFTCHAQPVVTPPPPVVTPPPPVVTPPPPVVTPPPPVVTPPVVKPPVVKPPVVKPHTGDHHVKSKAGHQVVAERTHGSNKR